MKSGIYKIQNNKNNNIYVGSSLNIVKRLKTHKNLLLKNKHYNRHIQNAWNKYGEAAFTFEIICPCPEFCLLGMEQYYINKHFDNCSKCYNICPIAGNCAGKKLTQEHKNNISKGNKGKVLSEETKIKISKSLFGIKPSIDTKEKQSNAKLGKPSNSLGKKASEITKQKMSESHIGNTNWFGKKHSEESKKKMALAKLGKKKDKLDKELPC